MHLGFVMELCVVLGPICVAIVVGVLLGWCWKPKWVDNTNLQLHSIVKNEELLKGLDGKDKEELKMVKVSKGLKLLLMIIPRWRVGGCRESKKDASVEEENVCSSLQVADEKPLVVTHDDFYHLKRLVEVKDGGPAWVHMMDRSTPNMNYQAWKRDPKTGPPQYRSWTVFEDAKPETVRDLFWDDEFRPNWDNMLLSSTTLEECETTGTNVVRWVRKFPFFCSDREYIIGRRIWESDKAYYCVTKGIPYLSVPRSNRPMRVDLYYSSWCIRAVESSRGDNQMTACEVLLFHHEDMGIPWELAKLGIKQGMWGTVQKIDPGLRAYQKFRASEAPISRCAFMANITTKIKGDSLKSPGNSTDSDIKNEQNSLEKEEKQCGRNLSKVLIMGGALLLACSLNHGLLTNAVILGVAKKFSKTTGKQP